METSDSACRTYNGADINADPGVNPQVKDGRGNLAPVTIILPTIAMQAIDKANALCEEMKVSITQAFTFKVFMEMLDEAIHDAWDMLKQRYELMCAQSPESAPFMYENNCFIGFDGEHVESALKHGTLAIGQLGLAECLQALVGCDHTEPRGMEFAKKIEQLFMRRCKEFKQRDKLNASVYCTPAQNLCYTAMKKFKERYGQIPNVSDREYFTNSIHVPVWHHMNPFEKIDIESQLTGYTSAGCITYVQIDGKAYDNIDAIETIVNYAMDHDVPYFALNVPIQYCHDCHYEDNVMQSTCPVCGSKNVDHLARVTGYLSTTVQHFNRGKQAEVSQRVKHT